MGDKPDHVLIRPYTPADKEQVLQIFRLNIPAYFSTEEEEGLSNYLDHELELYYVIDVDGRVIGSGGINFEDEKRTGIISWDIIHPDYQGKKLGSKLVRHRLEVLNGMDQIELIRVRTAQFTEGFYARQGFQLVEVIKDYWAKGYDLYRMEMNPSTYISSST